MFSTVPGFDRPNAARLSEKDVYVSARADVRALFEKKPKGFSFSSAIEEDMVLADCIDGNGNGSTRVCWTAGRDGRWRRDG